MLFDVHGALLVAVVAGVTALIQVFALCGVRRRAAHTKVYCLPRGCAALRHHGDAGGLLPARRGPAQPDPLPAGTYCCRCGGRSAFVKKNTLLSITAGTALYMVLVQVVFV